MSTQDYIAGVITTWKRSPHSIKEQYSGCTVTQSPVSKHQHKGHCIRRSQAQTPNQDQGTQTSASTTSISFTVKIRWRYFMHLVRNCGASKHCAVGGAGDCCSQKEFLASGICEMQSTVPKQSLPSTALIVQSALPRCLS